MEADNDGAQLHDKATRGATLSAAERERLDAWYAAQDAAEQALLSQEPPSTTVDALHSQIAAAAAQLQAAAQGVQEVVAQNAALREENAALHHRLAQRVASRMACPSPARVPDWPPPECTMPMVATLGGCLNQEAR